jgi:uncharacterized membrane protein
MSTARVPPRVLALALTIAACSWTAAIFFAPAVRGRSPALASGVDLLGSLICHQRDERSFHLHGQRLAVCGRCTGLYLAGAAGALIAWLGRGCVPSRPRPLLTLAALPTIATLAIEWIGLADPGNGVRALAALPLGGATGWLFVRLLRGEERSSTCAIIT